MASNIANIAKIPELRRRIFFTLALLAVYRIGVFVTVPGVDRQVMKNIVKAASGSFLGLFNMFSGGALGAALYLRARHHAVHQLVDHSAAADCGPSRPWIGCRKKASRVARRSISIRGTARIVISLVQAFFIARWLEGNNRSFSQYGSVVLNPGLGFEILTMLTLTTGTAFVMWLGEQITERGIGTASRSSSSPVSFARFPDAMVQLFQKSAGQGDMTVFELFLIAGIVVLVMPSSSSSNAAIVNPGAVRQACGRPLGPTAGSRRTCRSRSMSLASSRRSLLVDLALSGAAGGFVQSSWMQRLRMC